MYLDNTGISRALAWKVNVRCLIVFMIWWRHQIEIFSALLAICTGNSPVIGEFPAQRPMASALMFSLICVWNNKWLHNWDADDLRHHDALYDVTVMIFQILRHYNKYFMFIPNVAGYMYYPSSTSVIYCFKYWFGVIINVNVGGQMTISVERYFRNICALYVNFMHLWFSGWKWFPN